MREQDMSSKYEAQVKRVCEECGLEFSGLFLLGIEQDGVITHHRWTAHIKRDEGAPVPDSEINWCLSVTRSLEASSERGDYDPDQFAIENLIRKVRDVGEAPPKARPIIQLLEQRRALQDQLIREEGILLEAVTKWQEDLIPMLLPIFRWDLREVRSEVRLQALAGKVSDWAKVSFDKASDQLHQYFGMSYHGSWKSEEWPLRLQVDDGVITLYIRAASYKTIRNQLGLQVYSLGLEEKLQRAEDELEEARKRRDTLAQLIDETNQ